VARRIREKALVTTGFAAAQFDTIQLSLLKVGAEVRELKTNLHFRMPASFPLPEVFATMYKSMIFWYFFALV